MIGILTQVLNDNYGGLLQNYALQTILNKFNYQSITIDYVKRPTTPLYRIVLSWIKTMLFCFVGKKRSLAKYCRSVCRPIWADHFIASHIKKTERIYKLNKDIVKKNNISAIIVGSDQVWRPMFNYRIEDMFLKFIEDQSLNRIAYASSFGVDNWEYSPRQTVECASLAQKFDAISIRENSGVKLCKEHLGVDATWVLDPTLLLKKEEYLSICKDVPICTEKFLAVYVLDENELVTEAYEKEAVARGLVVKKFHAESKSTLTVSEWLAMFRDASYVVTDSFHGTVFSIIFGKEFKCLYNKSRGSARFDSLLKLYESGKLDEMREFSLNWLKNALEK